MSPRFGKYCNIYQPVAKFLGVSRRNTARTEASVSSKGRGTYARMLCRKEESTTWAEVDGGVFGYVIVC